MLNPNDRRYVSITLTGQGQKVYETIENICNMKYGGSLSLFPRKSHQQVLEGFNLLVDAFVNAGKTGEGIDCCGRNDPDDLEEVSF